MKEVFYQTRYCLTSGIAEVKGVLLSNDYVKHGIHGFGKLGVDIFRTMEEAKADQRKRAAKAIRSAEKKIAKMKKLLED